MPLNPQQKETGWISKWAFQVGAFAADVIGRQAIAAGYFAATATMRAKFADGFINADKIAANAVTDSKLHEDIKYWRLHRGRGDIIQLSGLGNIGVTDIDCGDPALRGIGVVTPPGAVGIIVQAQIIDTGGTAVQLKLRRNGETHWAQIFYCNAFVQAKTFIYMVVLELDDNHLIEYSISGSSGLAAFSLKLMGWVMEGG